MAPSYDPTMETSTEAASRTKTMNKRNNEDSPVTITSQVWQKSGSCPKGTIPIRRFQEKELLKTSSIEDYGRKKPSFSTPNKETSNLRLSNRSVCFTCFSSCISWLMLLS